MTQPIRPQILINHVTIDPNGIKNKSLFWVVENYSPDYYLQLKDVFLHEEPPIMVMGRQVNQRRDVGFYSDTSIGYRYSGQLAKSIPFSEFPLLKEILDQVNQSLGTQFNGILVNRYRNGEKYISAHSDDERALDKQNSMVVGISYGPATRKFRIRNKQTKEIVLDYQHKPLTLIAMQGNFQKDFTHEIPVEKRVKEERISLTFRHHLE